MDKIVQTIEARLDELKMSQKALADELGVLPSNLNKRLKSGSMKTKEVLKILDILGLELQITPK